MHNDSFRSTAPWQPDCLDGCYKNPVLFADYSDPDAIRVGDDYWMTSSSFCHTPGLPILHSKDLVNWSLVNYALPAIEPKEHFSQPRHGCGVWAPALRYHAGLFWIYFPDPDFGIQVITAKDPRGEWSAPRMVKAGKGLIDPCPLWDEDGRVYMIHGWAKSRSGICNLLTLHELSPDGLSVIDEGKVIIDANKMQGWITLEGPKLYKRNGWYYVFAPAGGVATGYQAVFRSRSIYGPYEARVVLEQGSTPINGPHQGAWVDTPQGDHWFFHFQEIAGYGRVVHLQPMRWLDDGWVGMGINQNAQGKGEPALKHPKPALPSQAPVTPPCSDKFEGKTLGLQWQWQANTRKGLAALPGDAQGLKLYCVPLKDDASHDSAAHLLMQKFPAPEFSATTRLTLAPKQSGDRAGLMVFGLNYAWIGLESKGPEVFLTQKLCIGSNAGGKERIGAQVSVKTLQVFLRVSVGQGARCRFSYSLDGKTYEAFGEEFTATLGRWVGAKLGLFASSAPGEETGGFARAQFFEVC